MTSRTIDTRYGPITLEHVGTDGRAILAGSTATLRLLLGKGMSRVDSVQVVDPFGQSAVTKGMGFHHA